ncbi:PREDICTED: endogenous retrovirus group K member 21 Rec protein-like [Chinchilla lanigera]|uniref:endogenous retrovirus group K member 21 Rec protein-like n=1 Tax=Chinchilla lanigera TaxID=34839 RepID=UPI000697854D|nr:PREDICTED: endogenous retrovirus group K member 21 Rec protein-like [Chinchilla lanigera]
MDLRLKVETKIQEKKYGYLLEELNLNMSHKRLRFDLNPRVEEMRAMSLQHHLQTPTRNTQKAQPPTWGQLKKLTHDAEKLLGFTRHDFMAGSMFLAMLAVTATSADI